MSFLFLILGVVWKPSPSLSPPTIFLAASAQFIFDIDGQSLALWPIVTNDAHLPHFLPPWRINGNRGGISPSDRLRKNSQISIGASRTVSYLAACSCNDSRENE